MRKNGARTLVKSVSEKKSLLFFYQRNILYDSLKNMFSYPTNYVRRAYLHVRAWINTSRGNVRESGVVSGLKVELSD